jgi:hypothetical protein
MSPTRSKFPKPEGKRSTYGHLALFHPSRLSSEEALNDALEEYIDLAANEQHIETLFNDTLNGPERLLEIVLSCKCNFVTDPTSMDVHKAHKGTDQAGFNILTNHIFNCFPVSASAFHESVISNILDRLSISLTFLQNTRPSDNLLEHRRTIERVPPVLQILASHSFNVEEPEACEDELGRYSPTRLKGRHSFTQKQAKRARQASRSATQDEVNPGPFINLGVQVPNSHAAAEQLEYNLLEGQRTILDVCGFPFFMIV